MSVSLSSAESAEALATSSPPAGPVAATTAKSPESPESPEPVESELPDAASPPCSSAVGSAFCSSCAASSANSRFSAAAENRIVVPLSRSPFPEPASGSGAEAAGVYGV
ncbi:hypothetical protein ACFQ0Q_29640 [Streptomyces aureus]